MRFAPYFFFLIVWCLIAPIDAHAIEVPERYRSGLIVVHSKTMAPIAFIGYNGEPKGIVVDVWRKWSEKTGVPVEIRLMPWKESVARIKARDDVVHGGLFRTPERLQLMEFSKAYLPMRTALVVLKDSTIKGLDDLIGKSVGVLRGGASEEYMNLNHPESNVVPFDSVKEVAVALVKKAVEAVFMDYPTIMYMGGAMGAMNDFVPVEFTGENQLRAGVVKGNSELLKLVNDGFNAITEEELDFIHGHWFVPPHGGESNWGLLLILVCAGGLMGAFIFYFGIPLSRRQK